MPRTDLDPLPTRTWRVLGLAAVGLLLGAVVGIALISAGVFDPRPVGALQSRQTPGARALQAGEQRVEWGIAASPQAAFSARLHAAYERGERDLGIGLALGQAQNALAVAVSPLGYVAVWEERAAGRRYHLPWQTWPHLRLGHETNEIQVDVASGMATVRVNRELLWQGPWTPPGREIALVYESFGGPAEVYFHDLALFHE